MQWDDSPGGGFTRGRPWLPLAADYRECNVAQMRADAGSLLNLYRDLIELRRERSALSVGGFRFLGEVPDLLAYERFDEKTRIQVFLNFSNAENAVALEKDSVGGEILISTAGDRNAPLVDRIKNGSFVLRENEGVIVAP
jgi:alpha-glucosidase